MSSTLHLTSRGHDKTALAIALLRELSEPRQDRFPTIWVLLATRRQELHFRQQLALADDGPAAQFNIEFFNFYSLNARLLKLAAQPVRRLSSLTRERILARLLRDMLHDGQLSVFHRIADTRGFVQVMAALIDELKQNSVDVDDFAKAARSPKDQEIAAIYSRYQETLRRSELADVEGEGWLALATLRAKPRIASHIDMLLAHGYDQFTSVQAALLAQLSRQVAQTHITLSAAPDDALPSRSQLALRRLQAAHDKLNIGLELRHHAEPAADRQPALHRLSQAIFSARAGGSHDNAIRFIEMPEPADEAQAVMRAVKRLLLDGARPDSILIVLRDWALYADAFAWGRDEFKLPLKLQYAGALSSIPVIAALIDLLELAPRFRRQDLLDSLRSPYFDWKLEPGLVEALDRLSLEQRFLAGSPADWLALVKHAGRKAAEAMADGAPTLISPQQAQDLAQGLAAFFEILEPPQTGHLPDYVSWLEGLLGRESAEQDEPTEPSPNIILQAQGYASANADIVERDKRALRSFSAILRELLASDQVLQAAMGGGAPGSWPAFWSELKHALAADADASVNQPRTNNALVTTATEARGLPHDHVFVLGLAEGIFPAESASDPLYLDSERKRMQARGIPLATRAERNDDRGLFYELISLPRTSLTLSRPSFQRGRAWIESYLWRAARAVFPDAPLIRRSVGAVIQPDEAANSVELMLAIARSLNETRPDEAQAGLRARSWLGGRPGLGAAWQRLHANRARELRRLSNAPFDHFSGILTRASLLEEVARRLGDERVWSATQLNDFGYCPFRFFAKRLLGLARTQEPERGLDALQFGALHHKILERTYRRIRARQLELHESNQAQALDILAAEAQDLFAQAPANYGFAPSPSWTQQSQFLLKRLQALIRLDFSADRVTIAGEPRRVLRLEERIDEFKLELGAGLPPLRVTALIDRVDSEEGQLVVIDYKTGSTRITRDDIVQGRDFQMMVYLSALMSEFDDMDADETVAGGIFWHLRNLQTSGRIKTDNEDDMAALEQARAHIAKNLLMARAGQFPVMPSRLEGGKCASYCEFSRLCRIQATGRYKPLPAAATSP